MERVQTLINRLQEQVREHADISQMQITLRLLQAELNQLQSSGTKTLGTSKVAVVLPSTTFSQVIFEEENVPEIKQEAEPEAKILFTLESDEPHVDKPEEDQPTYSYPKVKAKNKTQLDLHFDPMNEIPTFSQHNLPKEINESVEQSESLNDKLKESKTEVMQVLKETPIRDLRKAIGVNDRFVFINELFRGDEAMYERSIKTINSFNIFPEAEYWMSRELQVKLGWDNSRDIVQHFYHLVKRRFS